jgi:hypothetical protein
MKKTFACSGRNLDVNNTNNLYGDEIAELLCDDPTFILKLTESDLLRMNGFDIVTVLNTHLWLLSYFSSRMKNTDVLKLDDIKCLFTFNPELIDIF